MFPYQEEILLKTIS